MPYYRPTWNLSSVHRLTDDEFIGNFGEESYAILFEQFLNDREVHNNGKIAEKQKVETTRNEEVEELDDGWSTKPFWK